MITNILAMATRPKSQPTVCKINFLTEQKIMSTTDDKNCYIYVHTPNIYRYIVFDYSNKKYITQTYMIVCRRKLVYIPATLHYHYTDSAIFNGRLNVTVE